METPDTLSALKSCSTAVSSVAARWREALAADLMQVADILGARGIDLRTRVKAARSRLKRSRSLLRLAPGSLRKKARSMDLRIRAVRDELGGIRDAQAIAEAIADLKTGRSPTRRTSDRTLVRKWREWFDEAGDRAMNDLTEDAADRQAASLRRCAAVAARFTWDSNGDQSIVDAFRRDYRRARRRARDCAKAADAESLHRFRRCAIHHRFELELLLPGATDRLKRLEALRRLLGAVQDLEMLKAAVSRRGDGPDPDRLGKLTRRRQATRARRAMRLASGLFDARTRHQWPCEPTFYGPAPSPACGS